MSEKINFTRVVFGILFFILFSGKLFYDTLLQRRRTENPSSMAAEIFSMLGMAIALALVIGLVVLSIGLLVFYLLQDANQR